MIYSAIISCFDKSGRPDPGAIAAATEHNIEHSGVDGLFVNGSTGENNNMDLASRKLVLKSIADASHGRTRNIAHIGTNILEEFDELASYSAECGYDAVASIAPVYFAYTQPEYVRFFHTLADRSPLPLYVYNIPSKTHVHLTRESFKAILAHPNIQGVKFTDTDLGLFDTVRRDSPDADLLCGFDNLLLPFTALGGNGAIGTFFNLVAKLAKAVYSLTAAGKLSEAREKQTQLNEIMEYICSAGDMISSVKAIMSLYGIPCGECRFPASPITPVQRSMAARAYGMIEESMKGL